MKDGEGRITPENLRQAAGVRSDGNAGSMAAAATEIERLNEVISVSYYKLLERDDLGAFLALSNAMADLLDHTH